ncbi:MAG: glycyl-tRNA synthetase beta chain, partial [Pseudomonadota bacterium]|nr:glycyl-tRNA synthetase beta chain [Pseudomonadota bacterium]
LVELRTEELPPKALAKLGEVFSTGVHAGLADRNLVQAGGEYKWFATPRRLAVQIPAVLKEAPDAKVHEKIMPVSVALDAAGQPTQALLKKLEAKGIAASEVAKFEKRMDGKSETFFYEATVKGVRLEDVLGTVVGDALKKLPIPKVMRWGDSDVQFVRPVHGLVMLHGEHVAAGEVLGLQSGNTTLGHRFLAEGTIVLASAEEYEGKLETVGKAIVSFARRREMIAKALQAKADELGAKVKLIDALLDEVTALVEWPVIYVSEFESEYLEVPQECLILTMQANQKYFPLFDAAGKLQNRFLIVSNMAVADPTNIITGNARVVRPRLSDARFFFNQDRKNGFVSRAMKLGSVVYHNKLGSLGDRAQRLGAVAAFIGDKLGADANLARNAGLLCKVDLLTDMVGEFPELQGIMGRYYAEHEGAKPDVAEAMDHHYRPRFAGDVLPGSNVSCAVALADKLDALVGFFGIGQVPTGDKDPFGLRRAALGVLRILMEKPLPLDLGELIAETAKAFPTGMLSAAGFEAQLHDFMLDRLRGYLRDASHAQDAVEAVLSQRPTRIDLVPAKLEAVKKFVALDAALALAAANKRIGNILKKAEGTIPEPDLALLQEPAEKALFERVIKLAPLVKSHVANGDYADALQALATVRAEVDSFFDTVMVNVDEPLLRANRLGLLKALFDQLNAVADISKLAV